MKIQLNRTVTGEELKNALSAEFPQFKVSLERNNLAGFEYVLVQKSGAVGAFVRIKNDHLLVDGAVPSFGIRFLLIFLGFLFFFIALMQARSSVARPVADFLSSRFLLNSFSTNTSSSSGTNTIPKTPNEIASNQSEEVPQLLKILPIIGILLFLYFFVSQIRFAALTGFSIDSVLFILIDLLGIVSQVLLLKMKKSGFYILSGVVGLRIIRSFYFMGIYMFYGLGLLFVFFQIALIVLYAMNLKHYKSGN